MRKITLILAATLFVVSLVVSAEAANRLQTIRSAVPKVVDATAKGLTKVGDGITSFFWKNKASIVTGTALVVVATNPELVAESAVAVVNGPASPPIVIQSGASPEEIAAVVPIIEGRRSRPTSDWNEYAFCGVLITLLTLVVMYQFGGRTRTVAKVVTVALLIGVVLLFCNIVCADDFSTVFEPTCLAWPWGWRFGGDRIIDIVLVLVLLLWPLG